MTEKQANDVYDILVDFAGAKDSWRGDFVYHQTNEVCVEYRFQGALGFGGKFWRTVGTRLDGSFGEMWLINQYPEDENETTLEMILDTNEALEVLRSS